MMKKCSVKKVLSSDDINKCAVLKSRVMMNINVRRTFMLKKSVDTKSDTVSIEITKNEFRVGLCQR